MLSLNDIRTSPKEFVVSRQTDGNVLDVTSGSPLRIYRVFLAISAAPTPAVVKLYDATTAAGTDFIQISNESNYPVPYNLGCGVVFDTGLSVEWVSGQANDEVIVVYELS